MIVKSFYKFFIFIFIYSNINTHAHELGSYLFCVNQNNLYDWKWAPESSDGIENFNQLATSPDNRGTWINGTGGHNKYFNQELRVLQDFNSVEEARDFCSQLQKKCTNAYGGEFKYVAVASWSVSVLIWTYIKVFYYENKDNKRIKNGVYCPNWHYLNF
ncbi:hypothetical protein [Silvanigrella aquatica]|uniref:Uncharacterized protein n=1 Tax=Silvanigrella aquatica TaxID=1915309 RepID=A0A1L4CXK0_9BACT|nr:hypothetical protein [Silvanigrella aquatica]APJ02682.1 hypothetical protein AXG55_01545 [Silvanigrella aquatica]